MIPPVRLTTSLQREEAWQLDDFAHDLGLRRSHVMRAMLRFVLMTHPQEFVEWMREQDDTPAESPEDPTPEETA